MLRRAALALALSGLLVGGPAWAGQQAPAPEPAGSEQAELVGPVGGPVDRLVRWGLAVGGLLGLAGATGLYWTRETR